MLHDSQMVNLQTKWKIEYPPLAGVGGGLRNDYFMEQASANNNFLYNKNLKSNANSLRKNMTKAEACLWKYVLQGRRMKGFQFRRQRPVLNYIADFMCKELYLIIEVDGITHSFETVAESDSIRQKKLEDAGFTMIRFTDDEVLENIDSVMMHLEDWIVKKNPPPTPDNGGH